MEFRNSPFPDGPISCQVQLLGKDEEKALSDLQSVGFQDKKKPKIGSNELGDDRERGSVPLSPKQRVRISFLQTSSNSIAYLMAQTAMPIHPISP